MSSVPTPPSPNDSADAESPIRYGRQSIDERDIAAVVAVLRSDWLTQGPAVEQFEADLCRRTGARFAVAFSNGTAALHGAAAAADLGPGDVVAIPALTFSASAACAIYVGARPTLVDIDPDTLNLDPASVPAHVDALIAVHYAGLPVDLAALARRPAVLIEDAAHALGASTPDGPVGNCAHSDMTCFSFHPVKPITTAEGGAVTTNSPSLAERLRRFRNHGIERTPDIDPWHYQVRSLGFNYRLTDLQAALGSSQLARLDELITRRNEIAEHYRRALADIPIELPPAAPSGWRHGYHLFAIRVDERRRIFDGLHAAGVFAQVHYVPLHHHPQYQYLGFEPGDLPATELAYSRLISIPMHPGLTSLEVDRVVTTLRQLIS